MNEGPPFDAVRAAFWLIASIIGVHAATILTTDIGCLINGVTDCPQVRESMRDLLTDTMAAALAFGRVGRT